jgi:tetrapyrrole methylase family protein/MazG family protein
MSELKARVLDQKLPPFERLITLMEILRSPEGCNWDRQQNHKSLLPYLIEETYEVIDAINAEEYTGLKEELGDLLCQIVFHAQLASERGDFGMDEVINSLVEKLIHRHPHVFDIKQNLDAREVRDQWEKIKVRSGEKSSVMSGLPRSMPALTMAYRIGEKAGGYGFDWSRANDVVDKVDEELGEIKQELVSNSPQRRLRLEDEIGDMLFATASLARKLGIDPEMALKRALDKFRRRFDNLEREIADRGDKFDDYTVDQLEEIWQGLKEDK